ncbi:MAG: DUF6512 family protein [Bacillota bacterium]|nr:DUF6512 family protein [Bacillota bacterium]
MIVLFRTLHRAEYWGIGFVVMTGSLLHFVWEWSGRWAGLAPIAAVNESVWEHLKLVFWPIVAWAAHELLLLPAGPPAFWPAKAVAAYAAPALILVLHYGYRAVLGTHVVALDLLIFVIAAAAAQLTGLWVMTSGTAALSWPGSAAAARWAFVAVTLQGFAFWLATYLPPRLPLFLDSVSGGYGIR